MKKEMGTDYSPKAFHQSFMQMGTVPVVFFRDAFGVPVIRNVRSR